MNYSKLSIAAIILTSSVFCEADEKTTNMIINSKQLIITEQPTIPNIETIDLTTTPTYQEERRVDFSTWENIIDLTKDKDHE